MPLQPTQVTFRNLPHSDALEREILEHASWLDRFYDAIVSCRVRVELPHRHRRSGRQIQIRIELMVPGGPPIVVSREPSLHGPLQDIEQETHRKDSDIGAVHRDALIAVRDAFDAARRQLQDFAREQRGAVKGRVPLVQALFGTPSPRP